MVQLERLPLVKVVLGFAQTQIYTAEGGKERSLVLPFEEAATLHVNTQSDLEIETCVAANLLCAGPL